MLSKPPKKRVRKFLIVFLFLFGCYAGLCFALMGKILTPSSRLAVRPPELTEWEPVAGVPAWATDGVVDGTSKNVFIFSHGLRANRKFFLTTAQALAKRGYDFVILPLPGHDGNPDQMIGFGPKESGLIKSTIDKVKAEKIVLVGCSLGGASTWLASDHPRVSGIVTEGAYGRLEPVTRRWLSKDLKYGDIFLKPVIWLAQMRIGINAADVNPVETAAKWDHAKPALVIQALGDPIIPDEQAKELAKASGADLWILPMRNHAGCQDEESYVDRLAVVMDKAK